MKNLKISFHTTVSGFQWWTLSEEAQEIKDFISESLSNAVAYVRHTLIKQHNYRSGDFWASITFEEDNKEFDLRYTIGNDGIVKRGKTFVSDLQF
jgi:hypothetical protein